MNKSTEYIPLCVHTTFSGQEEEALMVINRMCRENNKPPVNCRLTVKNETCGEYSAVFQQPHTRCLTVPNANDTHCDSGAQSAFSVSSK